MFSIFKKNKIDTSSPSNFRKTVEQNVKNVSDLFDPSIVSSWGKKANSREYMIVLEDLARQGNVPSQEFVAQFITLAASRSSDIKVRENMYRKALEFSLLAAESGVALEALNVPITALKLANIVVEKNGGVMDEEMRSLFQLAYKWHKLNSENAKISSEDRKMSARKAMEIEDGWADVDE